jgi:hypothetical protein
MHWVPCSLKKEWHEMQSDKEVHVVQELGHLTHSWLSLGNSSDLHSKILNLWSCDLPIFVVVPVSIVSVVSVESVLPLSPPDVLESVQLSEVNSQELHVELHGKHFLLIIKNPI